MSNVFEDWMEIGVQAQFAALWADNAAGALELVPANAATFIAKTITILNDDATKPNVTAPAGKLTVAADAISKVAAKKDLYLQIVGLWHTFAKKRDATGSDSTKDDTFHIKANGDVVIQNKAGDVIATAQSHATITDSDFQRCHDMRDNNTRNSCVKYLAFVAGVGQATNRKVPAFTDLGKINDGQGPDLHAQVAHAYAVLKRVNWYARPHTESNKDFAYTFDDFSVEERKETSLQGSLKYMIDTAPKTVNDWIVDATTWSAAVADDKLSDLGRLVKECYTLVNANPNVKKAVVDQQRFSEVKTRPTGLSRMSSLAGPMRTLHGMYAAPGHSSHVLLPAMMGAGQVGGGASTAAGLRSKLDGLLPVLAQNNKRLSAETFAAFTRKLNTLEAYEKDVQDFMHRLRNVDTDKLNTVASPVVNDTDIVAFEKKSQAVTRATAVLSNALGNIAHYGRPIIIQNVAAPAAPTAAASGHYTL